MDAMLGHWFNMDKGRSLKYWTY